MSKRVQTTVKKRLSLFLALIMVLSVGVMMDWSALLPEAEAASQGNYHVRVWMNNYDTDSDSDFQWCKVYGKDKNGHGSNGTIYDSAYFDESTGSNYYADTYTTYFPTSFNAYWESHNCDESSYGCTVHIQVWNNNTGAWQDVMSSSMSSHEDKTGKATYSCSCSGSTSNVPSLAKVSITGGANQTIYKDYQTSATSGNITATLYDNWGYTWYEAPASWSTSADTLSSTGAVDSVTLTSTSYSDHSATVKATRGSYSASTTVTFKWKHKYVVKDYLVDSSNNNKVYLGEKAYYDKYTGDSVSGTVAGTNGGASAYYSWKTYKSATTGTVANNNSTVVYRRFWGSPDVNAYKVDGSTQNGVKFNINYNGTVLNDLTNEQYTAMPWGGTIKISNCRPVETGVVLKEVKYKDTVLTPSSDGVYTITYNGDTPISLYTRWAKSTLELKPNNGQLDSSNSASVTKEYNNTVTVKTPTRTGFVFGGWTKSNPYYGTNPPGAYNFDYYFPTNDGVTSTLTASWKKVLYHYYQANATDDATSTFTNPVYSSSATQIKSPAASAVVTEVSKNDKTWTLKGWSASGITNAIWGGETQTATIGIAANHNVDRSLTAYDFYPVYALKTTKYYANFNYLTDGETPAVKTTNTTADGDDTTGDMPLPAITTDGSNGSVDAYYEKDGKIYRLLGWSRTENPTAPDADLKVTYGGENNDIPSVPETAVITVPGATDDDKTNIKNLTPVELYPVYALYATAVKAQFKYYDASGNEKYRSESGRAIAPATSAKVKFPDASNVTQSYVVDGRTYTLLGWAAEGESGSVVYQPFNYADTVLDVLPNPAEDVYTFYPVYTSRTTSRYYYYDANGVQQSMTKFTDYLSCDDVDVTDIGVEVPVTGFSKISLDNRDFTWCGWRMDTVSGVQTIANTVTSENHPIRDAEYKYYAIYKSDVELAFNTSHDGITAEPIPVKQYLTQYINCGTGTADESKTTDVVFTVNPGITIPLKTGYTFIGWGRTDDEAESYDFANGASLTTKINTMLFARFNVNQQNVTFRYYKNPTDEGFDLEGDYTNLTKQVSYDDLLRDDTASNPRYVVTAPTVIKVTSNNLITSNNIVHANDKYHYVFREWVRTDNKGINTVTNNGDHYTATFKNVQEDITVQAMYDAYSHHYVALTNNDMSGLPAKYNPDGDATAAKDATCTRDGYQYLKCEDCGHVWKKILPAFNHIDANGNPVVTYSGYKAPTCEGTGKYATAACALCGDTVKVEDNSRPRYYDIVDGAYVEVESADGISPALGHNYEFSETVAPTCTAQGYDLYVCANNEMHTEKRNYTDALGHQEKKTDEVPASCTAEGRSEKIVCERCNMVIVDSYVIPALGHAMTRHIKVDPTCTAAGNIEYYTCSNCNKIFSDKDGKNEITEAATVVAALGHDFVETAAEPATCTKDGHTAGKVCSRCGAIAEGSTAVTTEPALGHDLDDGVHTASDKPCETAGYTTYSCQREGCDYTEVVYDELVDHTEKTIPEQPATCTEMGKSEYKVCDVCGKILTNYKWLPKKAHSYTVEVTPETPATCTEAGVSAVMKCANCGATVGGDAIAALGHNYSEWIVTAATCENAGSKTKYCKRCGTEITETIPALGHTPKDVAEVPATCTAEGATAGKICETCGTVLEGCEVIAKTAHSFGDEQIEREATCAQVGLKYVECSVCGYKEYTTIEKLPHTSAVTKEGKAATCTAPGLTDEITCSECGEVLQAQTATAKLEHVWQTIPAVAATCTEKGATAYEKCVNCDTLLTVPKDVPAVGHQWGEWQLVKAATCLEDGSRVRYCTVEGCPASTAIVDEDGQTKVLTKLGHDMTKVEPKDPACEAAGNIEYYMCSRCEGVYYSNAEGTATYTAEEIIIPAIGHSWSNPIVTLPTCTESGYTTITCANCGAAIDDEFVPATGHHGGQATCVSKAVCETCGIAYGGYAAHSYATTTVVGADCTERAVTTVACVVCGKVASTTYGEYGPHSFIYDDDHVTVIKDATCTEDGAYQIACSKCGETKEEVIGATGHVDEDGNDVCDKCGVSLTNPDGGNGTTTGTCNKCGRNHVGKEGGFFGYNGFICRLIAFFRMIVKAFGKK